ncbi:GNAT family N-acetyltransferase [Enterovirga rhinocerotis]|uniref:Acetyltransferase (GNAT) family protein n=1 Tax=Enterovirga rhinocerotis TaxID=1339210 RepID=A0A4R7BWM1_9HYPH|nr:GNAT family N-acetyltransferase [Enterovirga rhinocerotis]TDR89085.1 acetyltransferase (GNAT) family protein [Enterovirga rhinocerotis]
MRIAPLPAGSPWIETIARRQFEYWGALTGFASAEAYSRFLALAADADGLPTILVASDGGRFIGSVNVLASEMTIRPELTPWLGQLFVDGSERSRGAGRRLIDAAVEHAASLGFRRLYLFTSGTLPDYYRAHGWRDVEEVEYLGRMRTIMNRCVRAGLG